MTELILMCLAAGAVAGLLAGLFGVGGGLVIVPVLVAIFEMQGFDSSIHMHLALGSSLATIVMTSSSSVIAHHRKRAVDWAVFKLLAPGLVFGALLGAALADFVQSEHLRIAFGIGEILVAINMLRPKSSTAGRSLPGGLGLSSAGGVIGTLAAMGGIGGGTFMVPYLSWCGMQMQRVVATSAAGGLPIAIAGASGYAIVGWNEAALPAHSFGYLYLPGILGIITASVVVAPVGAHLAHKLPADKLKLAFAALLAGLGIKLLFF
jgi:uncharacterized membrane protein YfcA